MNFLTLTPNQECSGEIEKEGESPFGCGPYDDVSNLKGRIGSKKALPVLWMTNRVSFQNLTPNQGCYGKIKEGREGP